ncbi:MAG: hypothetical protein IPM56_01710 [Ignavibacteriales bacterium]|nr:MAG: hypothetical protein IPM56_01710 [Ignavibacteriales bacterium]
MGERVGVKLKFNFKSVFAARGIQSPTGFLRKAGFSPFTAYYISAGKVEEGKRFIEKKRKETTSPLPPLLSKERGV